jgi:hypothetical protein
VLVGSGQTLPVAVLLVFTMTAESLADDDKRACVLAHEEAQRLRLSGRLVQARAQLVHCTRPGCPDLVVSDCLTWLAEVDRDIPTVIVTTNAQGHDRSQVRVFLDGVLIQGQHEASPIEVDPGDHTFRVEAPGYRPVEEHAAITLGEKNRILRLNLDQRLGPEPPTTLPAAVLTHGGTRPSPSTPRAPRTKSLVLGGSGALALAAGGALHGIAALERRDLRAGCAPYCAEESVAGTRTKMIVGDALLGAGVVALAIATWMWLRD